MFWWGDSRRNAWISRRLFTCSSDAPSRPCLLHGALLDPCHLLPAGHGMHEPPCREVQPA